jgi:hypothetical protein
MTMPRARTDLQHAAADAEAWLDSLDPGDARWENPADLRAIGYALEKIADAERDLADAVAAARGRGRSWATIGTVLGVSKQSASTRYGDRQAG